MDNILSIVNPIYSTGKGTASMLAARGDKDAVELMKQINIEENRQGQESNSSKMPETLANSFCIVSRHAMRFTMRLPHVSVKRI